MQLSRNLSQLETYQMVGIGRRPKGEVVMVLQLEPAPKMEALHSYPAGTLERLAQLLAMGAPARPDPKRDSFFEVESDSEVFYLHVSPVTGRVLLIGTWAKLATPTTSTVKVQRVA